MEEVDAELLIPALVKKDISTLKKPPRMKHTSTSFVAISSEKLWKNCGKNVHKIQGETKSVQGKIFKTSFQDCICGVDAR